MHAGRGARGWQLSFGQDPDHREKSFFCSNPLHKAVKPPFTSLLPNHCSMQVPRVRGGNTAHGLSTSKGKTLLQAGCKILLSMEASPEGTQQHTGFVKTSHRGCHPDSAWFSCTKMFLISSPRKIKANTCPWFCISHFLAKE